MTDDLLATHTTTPESLYRSPRGYVALLRWYEAMLHKLPVAYAERTVKTRFGETYLIETGPQDSNAPPVVLLHGIMGNTMIWRPQYAALSQHHRVIAVDCIGEIGRSAPTRASWKSNTYGEWLVDVLDELGIEQASLVGLSKGASIIHKFSQLAPERISKAALISPMGLANVRLPFYLQFLAVSATQLIQGLHSRAFYRLMDARVFINKQGADVERWFMERSAHLYYITVRYFSINLLDSRLFRAFPVNQLKRLNAPTLVLVGEQDFFFHPQKLVARAKQVLPNLRDAAIIPQAGHAMHLDQPTLVNQHLLNFLGA